MSPSQAPGSEPGETRIGTAFAGHGWILHLLLLFNLALAPLYSVLGDGPEFFLAHSCPSWVFFLSTFVLSVGAPLGIALIALSLSPLGPRVLATVVLGVLAGLSLLVVLPAMGKLGLGAMPTLGISLAAAVGVCVLYVRTKSLRLFLTYFSWAALVFPMSFLFASRARDLTLSHQAPDPQVVESIFTADRDDVPIFLLVFDELPTAAIVDEEGRIDERNFPHFSRLSSQAFWFRNASTVSTTTNVAVPAILTGLLPTDRNAPTHGRYPVNLFSLVAPPYDVVAYEPLTKICPETICGDVSESFEVWPFLTDLAIVYAHILAPGELRDRLPTVAGKWAGFADKELDLETGAPPPGETPSSQSGPWLLGRGRQFGDFVASIDSGAYGKLHFIHSLLPHIPYIFLPDGRIYTPNRGVDNLPGWIPEKEQWEDDEALTVQAYQRALLQTRFVDRLLGLFLDRLHELGIFQDALIVVTADHGVNFVPGHERREFDPQTLSTGLMVPLFVKLPGQEQGEISDRNVQTIDVVPTLLGLLGKVDGDFFDGTSVFGDRADEPPAKTVFPERGDPVDLQADMIPLLLDAARQKAALFRHVDGSLDYYCPALFEGIIGVSLNELSRGEAFAATVFLESSQALENVEAGSGFLPSFLKGRIDVRSEKLKSRYLAIAIDGTVVSVAPVFAEGDDLRFSAIVPPESFREGANRPSFFALAEDPQPGMKRPVKLHKLSFSATAEYRLTTAGILVSESSGPLRKTHDPVSGFLRLDRTASRGVRILGRVYGGPQGTHAKRVLVFEDERLLEEAVARLFKGDYGFTLYLPQVDLDTLDPRRLRAYAVFDDDTFAEISIVIVG